MKKNQLSYLVLGVSVSAIFLAYRFRSEESSPLLQNPTKKGERLGAQAQVNSTVKTPTPSVLKDPGLDTNLVPSIVEQVPEVSQTMDRSEIKRFSSKLKHIEELRRATLIETIERKSSPNNEKAYRLSLIEDQSSRWKRYLVRDMIDEKTGKVKSTYIQIAGQIMVRLKDGLGDAQMRNIARQYGMKLDEKLLLSRTYLFAYTNDSLSHTEKLSEALQADSRIEHVSFNSLNYSGKAPNDKFYNILWGMSNDGQDNGNTNQAFQADLDVQADGAWDDITDCSSTPVAVLDTGIDPNHPDLKENVDTAQSRDFSSANQNDFVDVQSHGTHVAGTVGALGNNNLGVAGVCWKAKLIAIKVLDNTGRGTSAMLINGLTYAASTDAKVLNLSLGGGAPSQAEIDAINTNVQAGKLLVMAAGNENNDNDANPSYPASYDVDEIISVAAITPAGTMATFSNFGATSVDIAAPGQSILSTVPVGSNRETEEYGPYAMFDGTSMASPHVAGAVALFWSYAPEMTPMQVKTAILDSGADANFNNKSILTSKIMDLEKLMGQVQATVDFTDLPGQVSLENKSDYQINLAVEKKLSDIEKIEILHDEIVLGEASISGGQVTINLPIGVKEAQLTARITDVQGRVYTTDVVNLELDINKIINFVEVQKVAAGSVECVLSLKSSDGQAQVLHQASVPSGAACRKFCDISGPLVYSSQGVVQCSLGDEVIYELEAK